MPLESVAARRVRIRDRLAAGGPEHAAAIQHALGLTKGETIYALRDPDGWFFQHPDSRWDVRDPAAPAAEDADT